MEMDRARWSQVDRLFESTLEQPPHRRREYLERESGGDLDLLREVESLLLHDRDDSFLAEAAVDEASQLILGEGATTLDSLRLVGQRIDRFDVEEVLGAGGMGEVYRARDPRLGRSVALKLVPAHRRRQAGLHRRLRREALATSALNHPNILTVYEIVELDSHDVLVAELVDGVTLAERAREGPLGIDEVVDIGVQVARALEAAHAVGVIHRDVKPGNVMIRPDGLVKVLDFGIAKLVGGLGDADDDETRPGQLIGTVSHMSPEQARGEQVDARTDVWSLGVLLYELLTGRVPFASESAADSLAAILRQQPEPPSRSRPEVPRALEAVVLRALAKDRDQRYPDAAALAADLAATRSVDSRAGGAGPTHRISSRRWLIGLLLVALTVVALVVAQTVGAPGAGVDSLAVLPMVLADGGPQNEYLGDGLAENMIQTLAAASNLRVASRAAAFRFRSSEPDVPQIGQALRVRAVVLGRISRSEDGWSLRVELVDAKDGSHLWGSRYDVPAAGLPGLADRVSGDLLRRIDRSLDETARERVANVSTEDPEAYRLYLQARYYWHRTSPSEYHRGHDLLLRAIELDPDYALAWAGLGHYYGYAAAAGLLDPVVYWPRAVEAANRALERDPDLPEVRPLLASITLYWRREWERGDRRMRLAAEQYPPALNHYSVILGLTGRIDEARRYRQRDLDQGEEPVRAQRGWGGTLYSTRSYAEAVDRLREGLALDPEDAPSWELLGDALHQLGRGDEAVAAWARGLRLRGQSDLAALIESTHAVEGLDAAVVALARAQVAVLDAREAGGEYIASYPMARQLLLAGEQELGRRRALRAFTEHNKLVLDMINDPVFDPLREDPSFAAGVRDLNLPWAVW